MQSQLLQLNTSTGQFRILEEMVDNRHVTIDTSRPVAPVQLIIVRYSVRDKVRNVAKVKLRVVRLQCSEVRMQLTRSRLAGNLLCGLHQALPMNSSCDELLLLPLPPLFLPLLLMLLLACGQVQCAVINL